MVFTRSGITRRTVRAALTEDVHPEASHALEVPAQVELQLTLNLSRCAES